MLVITTVLSAAVQISHAAQRLEDLVAPLDGGLEPLVTAFNAGAAKARLVIALSPT